MMSEKEVNVARLSKLPVLRGNTRIRLCRFLVQALITAKEIILHEEFCEPAVIPDFMMSGNSYLLSKKEQYFKFYQKRPNITPTCQIMEFR